MIGGMEAEVRSRTANPWVASAAAPGYRAHRPRRRFRLGPLCGMVFVLAVSIAFWVGLAALIGRLW